MLRLVLVFVGIGAAVPVGEEQHASAAVGVVGTDDVTCFQNGVVIGHEVGILVVDFGTELFQFGSKVVAASSVSSRVGYTGTEVGLYLDIGVGAVGVKCGYVDRFRFVFVFLCAGGVALVAAGDGSHHHQQEQGSKGALFSFHNWGIIFF